MAKDPILEQTVPTKKLAEDLASILGCSGAHMVSDEAWRPCESFQDLQKLIQVGNPEFREWKKQQASKKDDSLSVAEQFDTQEEAEMAAIRIGCTGSHKDSSGKWLPCAAPTPKERVRSSSKPSRRVIVDRLLWENLRERGPVSIETLPSGGLVSGKASASDSFSPTAAMKVDATRGLEWRREFGRGGTMVGVARARDIANGRNLSYRTVKRMKAFFDRHQSDADAQGFRPGEDGYPSNGRIAWALWGGDAGYSWAKNIVSKVEVESKGFGSLGGKPYGSVTKQYDYAKNGFCLADGSFLILDEDDLLLAVKSYDNQKNGAKAKAHIIKRARTLGRLDVIPAEWKRKYRK